MAGQSICEQKFITEIIMPKINVSVLFACMVLFGLWLHGHPVLAYSDAITRSGYPEPAYASETAPVLGEKEEPVFRNMI